ncbi:F-box domain-containing protein [Pleurostoma richardsiae]|uniref:F-box domain-containing protein n=1 Tax=Pleurostoma richardsiae TaxID=41990 RepID=A0AA38S545_9PEZI|nr:F-box domain-containing protein [Pleurostoma richardsiae]
MASVPLTFENLPNEILIHILSPLSTVALVDLALVSRRFYDVIVRILHSRLIHAAALPEHELILECYHPSAKISTPYLHCDPLGTTELAEDEHARSLRALNSLYSRFRPVTQEENRRGRLRYPTAQSGGASTGLAEEAVMQDVNLDEGELFSQLCTVTNLVKVGPRRGLFLSHVNVSDGLIRVWRHWLAERTARGPESGEGEGESILWADTRKNVGLRFRVRENVDATRPVIVGSDEDVAVRYTLEYQELLVRTSQLLLMVEKSEAQEVTHSGKAIVIASV